MASSGQTLGDNDVFMVIDGPGDRRAEVIVVQTATTVAAFLAVILRFWARRVSRTKYGWDDWLILPALAGALVWYSQMWWALHYGFGKYMGAVTFAKLRVIFSTLWVTSICYAVALGFSKLSITALYLRAFSPELWARNYIRVLVVITVLWQITVILCTILQCSPVNYFWDRNQQGSCHEDIKKFYLAFGIVDIVTDCALMALPMYLCSRMNLGLLNKLLLCTVFASGFFVTVVSMVRIHTILVLDLHSREAINLTWTYVNMAIMSSSNVNVAVVCACLPMLRPLLARLVPKRMVPSSLRKRSAPQPYSPGGRFTGEARMANPKMLARQGSGQSQCMGLLEKNAIYTTTTTTVDVEDVFPDEATFGGRRSSEPEKDVEIGMPAPVYSSRRRPSLAPSWVVNVFSAVPRGEEGRVKREPSEQV